MSVYDQNSTDAVLSRILQRLDHQDRTFAEHRIELNAKLDSMGTVSRMQSARVSKLETWRKEINAKAVVVAGLVSAAVAAVWQWWLNRHSGS